MHISLRKYCPLLSVSVVAVTVDVIVLSMKVSLLGHALQLDICQVGSLRHVQLTASGCIQCVPHSDKATFCTITAPHQNGHGVNVCLNREVVFSVCLRTSQRHQIVSCFHSNLGIVHCSGLS